MPLPIITIVIDCSGSMRENGKSFILQQMIQYVREVHRYTDFQYFDALRFALWFDEIMEVTLDEDQEFYELSPELQGSLSVLCSWIEETKPTHLLLLSDGHFSIHDDFGMQTFKFSLKKMPSSPQIRCVSIGSDANTSSLKFISSEGGVFHSTQIDGAIATPWKVL